MIRLSVQKVQITAGICRVIKPYASQVFGGHLSCCPAVTVGKYISALITANLADPRVNIAGWNIDCDVNMAGCVAVRGPDIDQKGSGIDSSPCFLGCYL